VDRAGTTETLARQRFPLATSSKNKDDRLKYMSGVIGFAPTSAIAREYLIGHDHHHGQ
jgi:hypothetical protein